MDDKTALAVWRELSGNVTTHGLAQAAALVQFTEWVQRKASPEAAPDTGPTEGEDGDAG